MSLMKVQYRNEMLRESGANTETKAAPGGTVANLQPISIQV
jgi:hypothetical protein